MSYTRPSRVWMRPCIAIVKRQRRKQARPVQPAGFAGEIHARRLFRVRGEIGEGAKLLRASGQAHQHRALLMGGSVVGRV